MAPMSSADRMTRSDSRKPAASARSSPGVRMMTANERPCSRTSSGSSAAATSVACETPRPTRASRDPRVGARLAGVTRSGTTLPPVKAIVRDRAFEKRLAERGVSETHLVFHRQVGQAVFERRREESHAGRARDARPRPWTLTSRNPQLGDFAFTT